MTNKNILRCLFLISLFSYPAWAADVPVPVASDSRIKTFVYSENDVFNVVTHYGYQSNIEFGPAEEIDTISVGDRIGFQIVPAGKRLFIRPTMANARTNMTVVTNKRAYQFDLISEPTPVAPNEELAYVVRFFYPDDKKNALPPVAYSDEVAAPSAASTPTGGALYNYNYTFTGSDSLAPVKLYDDSHATYFKFRTDTVDPHIYMVSDGKEVALTPHKSGDYWVVDTVASRFVVRQGDAVVCVYNEKWSKS